MKDIALITDIPFWRIGLGKNTRILELCHFLAIHSHFTLYYLGDERSPFPGPSFREYDKQLQLRERLEEARHDLLIVQYIHLHWVADFPLKETKVYLDAHDLLSERTKSFESFNRKSNPITYEQELAYFRKFDKVMFMQKEEIEKVLPMIGEDHLLLCPHPIVPEVEVPFRDEVETISFFGSPSWPNIDGIQWFHDAVLPFLGEWGQKCIVNGTMSTSPLSIFSPRLAKGKIFSSLGDYYKSIDIAINPVLYGSGLKIKTVEALAYGIPLVATSAGAQGLREESGNSFLLADTPEEFARAVCALAESSDLRRRLSKNARLFAQKHLTPAACFGSLLQS
jgi:glycosyltransferase involved in cell wall biosynthesis